MKLTTTGGLFSDIKLGMRLMTDPDPVTIGPHCIGGRFVYCDQEWHALRYKTVKRIEKERARRGLHTRYVEHVL